VLDGTPSFRIYHAHSDKVSILQGCTHKAHNGQITHTPLDRPVAPPIGGGSLFVRALSCQRVLPDPPLATTE
jgi:hypothetical protein